MTSNYSVALLLLLLSSLFYSCSTSQSTQEKKYTYTNALINESSPYLLQHAHNPVNWHAWNDEALAKAKAENKMLIISVGYSACHWCHVMEHESFEDTLVAQIMNDNFISIKIDREERPDIDDIYMTACQLTSDRSCGWPLNAFALPNGQPVWAGTYFPKDQWIKILNQFSKSYKDDPDKMVKFAQNLTNGIKVQENIQINTKESKFTKDFLEILAQKSISNLDLKKGGRKGSPKFPLPNIYEFLLSHYHNTGNPQSLEAVKVTANFLCNGGIYDHLAGGWSRYSVDDTWNIPHFEKMLYDNGQIIALLAHLYQIDKNPLYKSRIEQTIDFSLKYWKDQSGGFYSSYDADSEGEEGLFYIWTDHQLDSIINDLTAYTLFKDYYNCTEKGNWEHGNNILFIDEDLSKVALKNNVPIDTAKDKIKQAQQAMFSAREKRIKPDLDNKILTSWNSLMITGLVEAYKALPNEKYLTAAIDAANFIVHTAMQDDGRLNRNYKDGKSVINAFLDDYAFSINAFIGVYEITFEQKWLEVAEKLADYTINNFHDKSNGMFFYTSNLDAELVVRKLETTDNVIPSSNSALALGLFRLGTLTDNNTYKNISIQMLSNMIPRIDQSSSSNFFSNWCRLYIDLVKPPYEVAVIGPNWKEKSQKLMLFYHPDVLFLGGSKEGNMKLLEGKLQDDITMIYVCQNKVCKLPVEDTEKALTLIK